jgi:hypothetical protein
VSNKEPVDSVEQQLQVLDVYIVDVLAHIEALLRHSHSIQRALLQLRSEAPPPRPAKTSRIITTLREHAAGMQRACSLLDQIVQDLSVGVGTLANEPLGQNDERVGTG